MDQATSRAIITFLFSLIYRSATLSFSFFIKDICIRYIVVSPHILKVKHVYILAVKLKMINQDRIICGDFPVNSRPIFFKFCKDHFLFNFKDSQRPDSEEELQYLKKNLESCVWREASFHSSHHSQEVFLAQFSLPIIYAQRWPKNPIHFMSVLDDCCKESEEIHVEEEEKE